ncbi:MAG: hypothetical protein H6719_30330 [Sandaracinaceae bacterium]|nr:hypothetical protein [Sandaracinaceae bacterium]
MLRRTMALGAAAILLALSSASCGPIARGGGSRSGGGGGGSAGFSSACRGDFGASAAASEFETFMSATYEFHTAAMDTQRTLLDACQQMGRALEMPAAQLSGEGPEGTRTVCAAVSQTLRTEMAAIREGTQMTAEVRTRPPHCEASLDAYASCAARCDVSVTPGEMEMRCEGGEIRGQCSATCTGHCAVDVQASCSGVCEGICEGNCSARNADGSCAGSCDGTCRGQCVAEANAQCTGECRGGCSVEWQAPRCTGHYRPPEVDANCRAACEAHVDATLECTPGEAELVITGGPDAAAQERIAKVREAVRVGLATVLTVRERVQRLQQSGRQIANSLERLPEAVRTVGATAALCSAGAVSDLTQSLASVSVSVEVSVSVSASVQGSAG